MVLSLTFIFFSAHEQTQRWINHRCCEIEYHFSWLFLALDFKLELFTKIDNRSIWNCRIVPNFRWSPMECVMMVHRCHEEVL